MTNPVDNTNIESPEPTEASGHLRTEPWHRYFTPIEWAIFAAIMIGGLIMRWTMLDMRPYHHDESLHGMYGRYFFDWPNNNFYRYDPMLHGPMLYNCMRAIYTIFGDSLWAARTPVCIMGSIFMLMPFLFRRFFGKIPVLILTSFVAFSPTLIYWSRFLREDYWVVSGMLMVVYGFLLAPPRMKALWVCTGLSVQWCTKENVFVTVSVFVGYLIFEWGFRSLFLSKPRERSDDEPRTITGKIIDYVAAHPFETIWGFVFAFFVYCWYYSAGFRFPQGIIDGLGYKGMQYWAEHHAMERIEGPFNFHVYVLGFYELPFLVAWILHLGLFYRRARSEIQFAGAFILAVMLLSFFLVDPATLKGSRPWTFFKLKDHLDLIGMFILLFHAPIVTIHHMLRREYGLAVTAYYASSTFFVYSFLGEKVPWLSLYPLVYGLPYLTVFFTNYFREHPINYREYPLRRALLWGGCFSMVLGLVFILEEWNNPLFWEMSKSDSPLKQNSPFMAYGALVALCGLLDIPLRYLGSFNVGKTIVIIVTVFNIRGAVQTNFTYAGKETEYLSQVHTTYDVADVAQRIVGEVLFEREMYRPKVLVTGEATWPLTWYFRNLRDEYKFSTSKDEKQSFTYIFQDWKDKPDPGYIPEGFYARRVNLRGWWVPDYSKVTLRKFLNYSINRFPWSPSGFTYTTLLVNKDRAKFKN